MIRLTEQEGELVAIERVPGLFGRTVERYAEEFPERRRCRSDSKRRDCRVWLPVRRTRPPQTQQPLKC